MLTLVLLLDIVQAHDCNPNKGFVYQRLTMWSASNTKMWGLPSKNSNHSSRVPTFLLLNKGKKKKKDFDHLRKKVQFYFLSTCFSHFPIHELNPMTILLHEFKIWDVC